jgi:CRISPR-associated DxTHG motif protein
MTLFFFREDDYILEPPPTTHGLNSFPLLTSLARLGPESGGSQYGTGAIHTGVCIALRLPSPPVLPLDKSPHLSETQFPHM